MKFTTDQLVNRLVVRFTKNIPDSNFDAAEHTHHADVRALRESSGIDAPKQGFDMVWIFTGNEAIEGIFDHRSGNIAGNRNTVAFTDAFDAIVGGNLDDHPEGSAHTGWRHRNPGLNIF